MLRIDLHYQSDPPFGPHTHEDQGIGGTENFIVYSAEHLARLGHKVRVYNRVNVGTTWAFNEGLDPVTVEWCPLQEFGPADERDILISFRFRDVFHQRPNGRLMVLMLADTESVGLGDDIRNGLIDVAGFVSSWQYVKIATEEGIDSDHALVTSNGIKMALFDALDGEVDRVPGRVIHCGTPERGLTYLLDTWPSIQDRVPWANLHLYSSFKGWGVSDADNEAMSGPIYGRIEELQRRGASIINHVHAPAKDLRRALFEAQVYAYPTKHFDETCCISALEAAAAGTPIVASARGALTERVIPSKTGYLIEPDSGHDHRFIAYMVAALTNRPVWQAMSEASVKYARNFDYRRITRAWQMDFMTRLQLEAPA